MILRWKNIFETGLFDTDFRNKRLVSTINEFYKYIADENIIDHAERIISDILTESDIHFSVEKEIFDQYYFTPERIEKHIGEHEFFMEELRNTLVQIQSGDLSACYKTADFLRSWIVKHMLGSDKEFASFVKNQQILKINGALNSLQD